MALYCIETYGELHPHLDQEWLLTNGLGGFASSTVVGCNTRRYHGVLCAATLPPVGRVLGLNRVGEILCLDDADITRPNAGWHELAVNQFGQGFHPAGQRYLRQFELDDSARWEFDVAGVRVVKELQILWMRNVAAVRYNVHADAGRRIQLSLLPFVGLRDFHAERRQPRDGPNPFSMTDGDRRVAVGDKHDATRLLTLWSDAGKYLKGGDWWYGHTYRIETDRGQDDTEDLFQPGRFTVEGTGTVTVTLWASLAADPRDPAFDPVGKLDFDAELARRREAVAAAGKHPENVAARPATPPPTNSTVIQKLTRAANDFVVFRRSPTGEDGTSVVAGYPWFSDWGRDTFISLPGLLLVTGRHAQARQVLTVFAHYVSEGMIPNRFNDYDNEPEYNTVDASLWFIHSAYAYLKQTGDYVTFEQHLQPACRAIVRGYRDGTRYGIRTDPADGLVTQGDANTQLTWMDAKCNGVAFTPRQGKPVEINALWYNALRLMNDSETKPLADKVEQSFAKAFFISPFRGLADVVEGSPTQTPRGVTYPRRDQAIRPNQIFAVSLPHSALNEDQQHAVVEVVRRELLTPVGLRTLSRSDPGYKGKYGGCQFDRDGAYHNGAVWPWPIGGFLEAYLKVHRRSPESIEQARRWLQPLLDHMDRDACIGQISEIFEADEPHRAVGCCAQAWSVAEVLRLAVELGM